MSGSAQDSMLSCYVLNEWECEREHVEYNALNECKCKREYVEANALNE